MKDIVLIVIHIAVTSVKLLGRGGARAIVAENLLLKQQLIVLCRPRRRAPNLTVMDRFLFGFGTLFLRPGRIRKIDIDRNVVRRILDKHYRAPPHGTGPSWLSFIGHTKDSLWSVDFFRCESVVLQSYWVLVVMDQFTRRIVGFGIHCGNVDGSTLCRMFNDAIRGQGAPRYLSTDHDPLFEFHRWKANLRILEIDEIKTVPYVPVSHPFVERVIGTVRREFLDHVLFWNTRDLRRKLSEFRAYYNEERVHSSLDGNTPLGITVGESVECAELDDVRWRSHCRGLVQLPMAA